MPNATKTSHGTLSCPSCGTLNRVDLARLEDGPRCAYAGNPSRSTGRKQCLARPSIVS